MNKSVNDNFGIHRPKTETQGRPQSQGRLEILY